MASKNKQHLRSPLVVSTDCTGFNLKSLYRSCRSLCLCSKQSHDHENERVPLTPTEEKSQKASVSPSSTWTPTIHRKCNSDDSRSVAEAYLARAHKLELELVQLKEWLNSEIEMKKRKCLQYEKKDQVFEDKKQNRSFTRARLIRLADGSYLHSFFGVGAFGGHFQNLALQVSAPAIVSPETGSNISQILNRMALMGRSSLINWLLKSMPMCDMSGKNVHSNHATLHSEESFLEAVLLKAIDKLEILALEGLHIQICGQDKAKKEYILQGHDEDGTAGEFFIEVMLVQVRDRDKNHEVLGDLMIGLVEVKEREEVELDITRVHVAGFSRGKEDGRANPLWCISM